MLLSKDLREFLALLNSNGVEYLVVGGFAVSYHGFARYTADLDFFVRASEPNSRRMLAALVQFGFGNVGIQAEDFQSPGKVIQLGVQPNRIDILTSISGACGRSFCGAGVHACSGSPDPPFLPMPPIVPIPGSSCARRASSNTWRLLPAHPAYCP